LILSRAANAQTEKLRQTQEEIRTLAEANRKLRTQVAHQAEQIAALEKRFGLQIQEDV